jgi:hypothetical protein
VNREVLAGYGRLAPPDAGRFAAALTAAAAGPRDPTGLAGVRARFGRDRHAASVMDVYRFAAECRTFGTPVRDDASGSESCR